MCLSSSAPDTAGVRWVSGYGPTASGTACQERFAQLSYTRSRWCQPYRLTAARTSRRGRGGHSKTPRLALARRNLDCFVR
jgi:hypothetical protein